MSGKTELLLLWCIALIFVAVLQGAAGLVQATEFAEDKISLGGDFRYRQEYISIEDDTERLRHRLRLRLNVLARVNRDIDVLATIASGINNVGANNQTLDDAFDTKPVSLYRAYVSIHPQSVRGLRASTGKVPNPFYLPGGSELVWYVGIAPEGMLARYRFAVGVVELDVLGFGFFVEERPITRDSYLTGGQAVVSLPVLRGTGITVGTGLYAYGNMRGLPALHEEHGSGNTLVEGGVYAADFTLVEGFAECRTELAGLPVAAAFHVVENTAADSLSSGYWFGGSVGRLTKQGKWRIAYSYRRVEADAVVGWLTDALFAGGRSDAGGHRFRADVRVLQGVTLALTYFHTWTGVSQDMQPWYRSGQADLVFGF